MHVDLCARAYHTRLPVRFMTLYISMRMYRWCSGVHIYIMYRAVDCLDVPTPHGEYSTHSRVVAGCYREMQASFYSPCRLDKTRHTRQDTLTPYVVASLDFTHTCERDSDSYPVRNTHTRRTEIRETKRAACMRERILPPPPHVHAMWLSLAPSSSSHACVILLTFCRPKCTV